MRERRRRGMTWVVAGVVAAGAGAAHAQPAPPDLPPPSTAAPQPASPPAPSSSTSARPPPPPPPPPPYGYPPAAAPAPGVDNGAPGRHAAPSAPYPGPTYYAPSGVPAQNGAPPPVLPVYDPDQPVPQGYRLQSRPTVGLLGMGIGMFSAGYVTSVVMGIVLMEEAKKDPTLPDQSVYIPMYIPVAGPFITMAVMRPGPAEIGLLLTDGIFQLAGSLGILVGSLKRSYRLVYTGEAASLQLAPAAGMGFGGLQATGQF